MNFDFVVDKYISFFENIVNIDFVENITFIFYSQILNQKNISIFINISKFFFFINEIQRFECIQSKFVQNIEYNKFHVYFDRKFTIIIFLNSRRNFDNENDRVDFVQIKHKKNHDFIKFVIVMKTT